MRALYLNGIGLWTPGFASAAAWLSGQEDPSAVVPSAALLPTALRRRATVLTRMAADVVAQAVSASSLSDLPVVLGSAYGEIDCAVEMMSTFREGEGLPSPTRFHNSVHNAAAAYLSIASGSRGFSTAISAGLETSAAALHEAWSLLAERGGEVLVVLADEPCPAPFTPANPYPAAAVALLLASEPRSRTLARLGALFRATAGPAPRSRLAAHPCVGGIALVAAAAAGLRGRVDLGPFDGEGWCLDVEPGPVAT